MTISLFDTFVNIWPPFSANDSLSPVEGSYADVELSRGTLISLTIEKNTARTLTLDRSTNASLTLTGDPSG